MSSKCGKCDSAIITSAVSAKCVECNRVFHPACTRLGSEQNFTKTKSKSWKCDGCRDESTSTTSNKSADEEDRKSIIETLQSVKREINRNIDEKISTVLSSVSGISEELKNLQSNVSAMEASLSKVDERCGHLERENDGLRKDVSSLQQQLRDAEQHQRAANLEIVGLPCTEGEDIYACLQQVAAALDVLWNREDISIAHRLRLYSRKRHTHPPIICQFVSRSVRTSWLSAARNKKHLAANEISRSFPPSPVYINEHLTRDNKMLLGKARRLMKDGKLHFAGYVNGKILVRTTPTADPIQVTDILQLDTYV